MKSKIKTIMIWLFVCMFILSGCQSQSSMPLIVDGREQKIYFFDHVKNELVAEPLGDEFKKLKTDKEQVAYIINRLVEPKALQVTPLQNITTVPYMKMYMGESTEENAVVEFHFTKVYNDLSPTEKMGVRSAVVYSLTGLRFISGVEFYVEDTPLVTAAGKTVGVIYPSFIKLEVLDPNPATTPYNLSLYFKNAEGKLAKEDRCILVSDTASVEKLLLEELIKGPVAKGLSTTMPDDVKVNEAQIAANGVCQVDLTFDPKSKFFATEESKQLMLYSIVDSLTELPEIKKVVVFLDGKSGIAFTQDIDFGDILERSEAYISTEQSSK